MIKRLAWGFISGNVEILYKGHFFENLRDGLGEMHWADGRVYKGQWHAGTMCEEEKLATQLNQTFKSGFQEEKFIGMRGESTDQSFYMGPQIATNIHNFCDQSREKSINNDASSVLNQSDILTANSKGSYSKRTNFLDQCPEAPVREHRSVSRKRSPKEEKQRKHSPQSKTKVPFQVDESESWELARQDQRIKALMNHQLRYPTGKTKL